MYYMTSDTRCSRNSYKQENQILLYIKEFINVLLNLYILVIKISFYQFVQIISFHSVFEDFIFFLLCTFDCNLLSLL